MSKTVMGYAKEFRRQLIKRSVAKEWSKAKLEWIDSGKMFRIKNDNDIEYYILKYPDVEIIPRKCICGHGIQDHCVIKNETTGKEIAIGNCCIKKFETAYHMGIAKKYTKISNGIKQLRDSLLKNHKIDIPPVETLFFLLENKCINEAEYRYLSENLFAIKHGNVRYEEYRNTMNIVLKIIKLYYNTEITREETDNILYDIMMCRERYKERYYNENIEKSPGDETHKYKLFHNINNNTYEWKLTETSMTCEICHNTRMIMLDKLVNVNQIKKPMPERDIKYFYTNKFMIDERYCVPCYMKENMLVQEDVMKSYYENLNRSSKQFKKDISLNEDVITKPVKIEPIKKTPINKKISVDLMDLTLTINESPTKQQLINEIIYKVKHNKFDTDITNLNEQSDDKLEELMNDINRKIISKYRNNTY